MHFAKGTIYFYYLTFSTKFKLLYFAFPCDHSLESLHFTQSLIEQYIGLLKFVDLMVYAVKPSG